MRQSITTRYIGPTNSRGSRIKATARKRSASFPEQAATVPYGYGNTEEEHCKGAKALAEKLGWSGLWVGGGNEREDGYVFVNVGTHQGWVWGAGKLGTEGRDWFHVSEPTSCSTCDASAETRAFPCDECGHHDEG